ncbi:unnamed protein product [Linum tenue]
MQTRS